MLVHMFSRQTSLTAAKKKTKTNKKKRGNEDVGQTDKVPVQLMH